MTTEPEPYDETPGKIEIRGGDRPSDYIEHVFDVELDEDTDDSRHGN